MSAKTVRVICALPSHSGIVFRSPYVVTSAFDGEGHGETPQDLELKHGVNENVSAGAVRFWAARTNLSWKQVGDTVTLSYDADWRDAVPGETDRENLARQRRALDAERRALYAERRKAFDAERAAIDAERKRLRARARHK